MIAAVAFAFSIALVPPTALPVTRSAVSSSADVSMMAAKKGLFNFGPASPTKPKVTKKAKPLSPGSNYPATKNIQKQSSGFGSFVSAFEKVTGKSKYGMPVFLENGNINPAYLAAERKAIAEQSKKNVRAEAKKTKKMKAAGTFELGSFIKKKVGNVGSGKETTSQESRFLRCVLDCNW